MPELPEVETICQALRPIMTGAKIVSVETKRPDLRFPLPRRFANRLVGQSILTLDRRAKYLVAHLSSEEALIMHLGMTGRFFIRSPGAPILEPGSFYEEARRHPDHDHVMIGLLGGTTLIYNDQRRFGFMDLITRADLETCRHFKAMGVEPLDQAFDDVALAGLLRARKVSLKAALLDQKLIAGLGNIYVSEALHRSGLSPFRKAGTLVAATGRPKPSAALLVGAIRDVLREAIEAGGSTLRDYAHPSGAQGRFQDRFLVYDREGEGCMKTKCAGRIRRVAQAGRSTYYCPVCQR